MRSRIISHDDDSLLCLALANGRFGERVCLGARILIETGPQNMIDGSIRGTGSSIRRRQVSNRSWNGFFVFCWVRPRPPSKEIRQKSDGYMGHEAPSAIDKKQSTGKSTHAARCCLPSLLFS